jgi:hypothetical protein
VQVFMLRIRSDYNERLIKLLTVLIVRLSFWRDYLVAFQTAANLPERYDRPDAAGRYSRMENR